MTVAGVGLFGVTQAQAQDTDFGNSSLIQKIADKFGLKKDDVQAVFDQERSDRQAKMQQKGEAQLDQLVKDGKITDAQKKLILAKRQEFAANRKATMEKMQSKTPQERKAAMESERNALNEWAKQNGIDPQYLFGRFGIREHGMRFMH